MKKIIYLLIAVFLMFSLVSCNEDKTDEKTDVNGNEAVENIGESNTEQSPKEEEKKPEVFYTGVVCQLPSNGTAHFTALKTDGTYDRLGERGVYGYPEITEDGKYIFYRQTQADPETREYTERLFVMTPANKAFELAENATAFTLDKQGRYVVARCKDGLYFTTDFSKKCEKILDMESISSFIVSESGAKAAVVNSDTDLVFVDIATKTSTPVDTGVTYVMKRVCDNALYYAKEDGLYLYSNGTSSFVSSWWLSTDFPEIFATGTERERQYHFLNSSGVLIDIEDEAKISSYTVISPNRKYLVSGSGATIFRYEITENGLTNKTELHGKNMTIYRVNNDGIVLACSANDQSFGIFETSEYKKLSDGMLLINRTGFSSCVHFANDCVYFIKDNVLYKYTFGGETETLKEDVYSIAANGNWCYYTANYDKSSEKGDLFAIGKDEMIDDNIKYVYVR